jgi:hypothetical protein
MPILDKPPEEPEGDDSVNRPDEAEIVTAVDFEDADDLQEADVDEDELDDA